MKKKSIFLLSLCIYLLGQGSLNAQSVETKKALLIIDIQNDYFEGGTNPLVGSFEASLNAQKVLNGFREKSLTVIHIQHLSLRLGSTFFIPNTVGVEIHKNVAPLINEKIVVKNYPNSFHNTELLEYLKTNDVTDLVICGMMTHMCVDATTRAAKDFGFNCTIISDACATKDLEVQGKTVNANDVQTAFIAALNYFYSAVKKADDYLLELLNAQNYGK